MAIEQKLVIDKGLSNQFQIIVRDETGAYSPSNTTGYGGNNGSPIASFNRYIFDIVNLNTGNTYRQIQSDDIDNPDEFYNPSVERIANKENVILDANNFNQTQFPDGVYKVTMSTELEYIHEGEGYQGVATIVNVPGAKMIARLYDGIIVGNNIYYINSYEDSTLILDRLIVEDFNEFKPILKASKTFTLYDSLNTCLDTKLAQILSNCGCEETDNLNATVEFQILDWGLNRAIGKEDYLQAKEYMDLLYKICSSFKCGCTNGCN